MGGKGRLRSGSVVREPLVGCAVEAEEAGLVVWTVGVAKVLEQGRDVIGVGVRKTSLTAERTDWW